jgi:uncharacterized protein (DUF2225 family)
MADNGFVLSGGGENEDKQEKKFALSQKGSALKVSFLSKELFVCPACDESFRKEDLLSGSGRLIAGTLTEELHRLYEKSAKYGDLYPVAYTAVVCPKCWFASSIEDFSALPPEKKETVFFDADDRKAEVENIFPAVDFYEPRNLVSGIVSQYLTMRCYDYYTIEFSPSAKQGIAALRTSWLLDHINEKEPGQNWDWLSQLFKRKARFFYSKALEGESTGKEKLSGLKTFGPDLDKNYNYEGFLYICGLLEFKYGDQSDLDKRKDSIAETKRTLAKMFGIGKSSKNKPGPLLEKSRNLYDLIAKELNEFDE